MERREGREEREKGEGVEQRDRGREGVEGGRKGGESNLNQELLNLNQELQSSVSWHLYTCTFICIHTEFINIPGELNEFPFGEAHSYLQKYNTILPY